MLESFLYSPGNGSLGRKLSSEASEVIYLVLLSEADFT